MRRREFITGAAALAAYLPKARALTPDQRVLLLGGAPSWVTKRAVIDMDFANGRYYGGSLASMISIARASPATDLLPTSASGYAYNTYGNNVSAISPGLGLLAFRARTNVLLNSTAPATQTSGSLATGTYTLWCNGSGSVTPSGGTATITGAAAATNGAPNVFVVTVAGTVVFTVSGSLNAFQCELGGYGTSLIVTAGASATRVADNTQIVGRAATILNALTRSIVVVTNQAANPGTGDVIGSNSGADQLIYYTSPTAISSVGSLNGGGTPPIATPGSGTNAGVMKIGIAMTTALRLLVANNGTVMTDAHPVAPVATIYLGNYNGLAQSFDGAVVRLTAFTTYLPSATLKALTI